MKILRFQALFVFFSVATVISGKTTVQAESREFTPQEQQLLDSGKLVKREVSRQRGSQHFFGGTSWQVINANPDQVWKVINDERTYGRLFPYVVKVKLLSREGASRTVYMEHASGPFHVSYALKGHADNKRRDLTFELDNSRSWDIESAWGFFTVRPYGNGKSILAYGVMLDIGPGLLRGLLREKIRGSMLHIPRDVRKYIQKRYPPQTA